MADPQTLKRGALMAATYDTLLQVSVPLMPLYSVSILKMCMRQSYTGTKLQMTQKHGINWITSDFSVMSE